MIRVRGVPVAVLLSLALAAPASGATVSAAISVRSGELDEHRLTVTYRSPGRTADRVRVVFRGQGIWLRARGTSVGRGCTRQPDGWVRCAHKGRCECYRTAWLRLTSGAANDTIRVSHRRRDRRASPTLEIDAGAGDDTVTLRSRDGISGSITGGAGDDRLAGHTQLFGGAGDDRLTGGGYDLAGGAGRDVLRGTDTWFDGDGPNKPGGRPARPAADLIDGEGSRDRIDYAERRSPITVDLSRGLGADGDTLAGIEEVLGGHGDDVLIGGAGHDDLDGGPGRDRLIGAAGNDILTGGEESGDDVVSGGAGDDRLEAIGPGSSCGPDRDIVNSSPDLREPLPRDCERVAFGPYWTDQHELRPHDGRLLGRTAIIPLSVDTAILRLGGRQLARGKAAAPDGPTRFRLSMRGAELVRRAAGRVTLRISVWECCGEEDSEYLAEYELPLRLAL
jgi:RTX calcium-binding nonapeptide repeat (4 copies)